MYEYGKSCVLISQLKDRLNFCLYLLTNNAEIKIPTHLSKQTTAVTTLQEPTEFDVK